MKRCGEIDCYGNSTNNNERQIGEVLSWWISGSIDAGKRRWWSLMYHVHVWSVVMVKYELIEIEPFNDVLRTERSEGTTLCTPYEAGDQKYHLG